MDVWPVESLCHDGEEIVQDRIRDHYPSHCSANTGIDQPVNCGHCTSSNKSCGMGIIVLIIESTNSDSGLGSISAFIL
jgi:hypothetical protein